MTKPRPWIVVALVCACAAPFACGSVREGLSDDGAPDSAASAPLPPAPPGPPTPAFTPDATVDADAADGGFATCAAVAVEAERKNLPVDIILMVDNSASMAPAVAEVQAGLNGFAALIGSRGLDYQVVLLSLRGTDPFPIGGSLRYPMCIPPPLGGADCENGPHFFHAAVDVFSTQTLEQILGTLDQTMGYTSGAARGSVPWAPRLRAAATKSFVLVTDDNSRFPAVSFEGFPGGPSPYTNGLVLPAGLLHPSRGGAFKGYTFNAIYGWGSTADPSIRCTYPDGTRPPTSGSEYSTLVAKTGGVRAQLCDGPSAWAPFFTSVATAVVANARVACELPLPALEAGVLDPDLVNVRVTGGDGATKTLPRVATPAACGAGEGWYYDAPAAPTKVSLCPQSCEAAQSPAPGTKPPRVDVLLGCKSVVR